MAQLTIQVTDELDNRSQPILHRLPELLSQLLKTHTPETLNLANSNDISISYTEVLDFLITQPIPEQIAKFKLSDQAQTQLQELLEKIKRGQFQQQKIAN